MAVNRLTYCAVFNVSPAICFDLARDVEVHCETSRSIAARAVGGRITGLSERGDETTWSARFFGIAWRLTTKVSRSERPWTFSEELVSGPIRSFAHEYTFTEAGPGKTFFSDEFTFESRCGALFDWLVIRPILLAALKNRGDALREIARNPTRCDFIQKSVAEASEEGV